MKKFSGALLVVLALLASACAGVVPAVHSGPVTIQVDELLANPEVHLGETIRIIGDDLVRTAQGGRIYGVLYSGETQIFVEWRGEAVSEQTGDGRVAVTGVWTSVSPTSYHLIVGGE